MSICIACQLSGKHNQPGQALSVSSPHNWQGTPTKTIQVLCGGCQEARLPTLRSSRALIGALGAITTGLTTKPGWWAFTLATMAACSAMVQL